LLITFDTGKTGLETVGYQILNDDGTEYAARTITDVAEIGTSGSYGVTVDNADLAGRTVVWDTGEVTPVFHTESFSSILGLQGTVLLDPEPDANIGVIDSILTSIKKLLGIGEDYTQFDSELIMYINSVFSTLLQLGVGPTTAFRITGTSEEWDDFLEDATHLESVKTYIYLRVRLMFDPPQTGYLVEAITKQILEHEWRMNDWTVTIVEDDDEC
jgi:hypothetical protein